MIGKLLARLWLGGVIAASVVTLASCSGDDGGETTGQSTNGNANLGSAYVKRLEFPKLKTDNVKVIVHTADGEVNYAVEWDTKLNSQHWTCYEMYDSNSKANTTRYYGDPQYPQDPLYPTTDLIRGSGYDHGHICPSADRLVSKEQNYQTFYQQFFALL